MSTRPRLEALLLLAIALAGGPIARAGTPEPTMADLSRPEGGLPTAVIAAQAAYYDEAADSINRSLARAIARLAAAGPDSGEAYTAGQQTIHFARMREEIDRAIRAVGGTPRSLDQATGAAALRAIAEGEAQIRELGLDPMRRVPGLGVQGPSFTLIDRRAVEAIARDTVAKAGSDVAGSMLRALDTHGRAAGDLFRRLSDAVMADGTHPLRESAANRAIARGLITGDVREAAGLMRDVFRDPSATEPESYRRLGNKIIAVGRAEMTVRSYAAMVVRTRTREATVAARHERLTASGIGLVQITGRVSANFCTAFIGLVCSLAGESVIDGARYPALSSLPGGGPPFHSNCTKGTAAYIPDLVSDARATAGARALVEFTARERQGRLLAPARA